MALASSQVWLGGYQAWANNIQKEGTNAFAEGFVGIQPWGTPDEMVEPTVTPTSGGAVFELAGHW